jgi:hypothetical protein
MSSFSFEWKPHLPRILQSRTNMSFLESPLRGGCTVQMPLLFHYLCVSEELLFREFGCGWLIWVHNGCPRPRQSPVLVCISWCVFITKPGDSVKIIRLNSHGSKSKKRKMWQRNFLMTWKLLSFSWTNWMLSKS